MKLGKLFSDFCFHDGDLVDITINQDDIIMAFSLPIFLQNKQLQEVYKINENSEASSLELVLRFTNFSRFQSEPFVEIGNIDLDEYELWHIQGDEQNQETTIQLRKYGEDSLLTISFTCRSVEIVSCEIKN